MAEGNKNGYCTQHKITIRLHMWPSLWAWRSLAILAFGWQGWCIAAFSEKERGAEGRRRGKGRCGNGEILQQRDCNQLKCLESDLSHLSSPHGTLKHTHTSCCHAVVGIYYESKIGQAFCLVFMRHKIRWHLSWVSVPITCVQNRAAYLGLTHITLCLTLYDNFL